MASKHLFKGMPATNLITVFVLNTIVDALIATIIVEVRADINKNKTAVFKFIERREYTGLETLVNFFRCGNDLPSKSQKIEMLCVPDTVDIHFKTLLNKQSKMTSTNMNSNNFDNFDIITCENFDKTMPLYIPRVDTRSLPIGNRHAEAEYETMTKDFISKQFKYQHIGQVSRVDLLKKQTPQGFDYFIAFVHFSNWFDTPQARSLQDEINTDGAKAKLQFHEKWYWIVNENKSPLSANEASLHKTIYEQAKRIDKLNEAVVYLKSMKNINPSAVEATLAQTAQQGFGSSWRHLAPCTVSTPPALNWHSMQNTAVSPRPIWDASTDFPHLDLPLTPPRLERSVAYVAEHMPERGQDQSPIDQHWHIRDSEYGDRAGRPVRQPGGR